jgi:hypothetical protein
VIAPYSSTIGEIEVSSQISLPSFVRLWSVPRQVLPAEIVSHSCR